MEAIALSAALVRSVITVVVLDYMYLAFYASHIQIIHGHHAIVIVTNVLSVATCFV